jgi:hypothetical protein
LRLLLGQPGPQRASDELAPVARAQHVRFPVALEEALGLGSHVAGADRAIDTRAERQALSSSTLRIRIGPPVRVR